MRLYTRAEIESVWPHRPLQQSAYRASIEPLSSYRRMQPGVHNPFRVRVRNEGDTHWPGGHSRNPVIRLSYHWRATKDGDVIAEGLRSPLPGPLAPGEACIAPVIVAAPEEPGQYILQFDLVHENVRWFDCPLAIGMRIEPNTPSPSGPLESADGLATIGVLDRYRWLIAGWRAPFCVVARNEQGTVWPGADPERPIRLGYRWFRPGEAEPVADGFRTAFPVAVRAGEEVYCPNGRGGTLCARPIPARDRRRARVRSLVRPVGVGSRWTFGRPTEHRSLRCRMRRPSGSQPQIRSSSTV